MSNQQIKILSDKDLVNMGIRYRKIEIDRNAFAKTAKEKQHAKEVKQQHKRIGSR